MTGIILLTRTRVLRSIIVLLVFVTLYSVAAFQHHPILHQQRSTNNNNYLSWKSSTFVSSSLSSLSDQRRSSFVDTSSTSSSSTALYGTRRRRRRRRNTEQNNKIQIIPETIIPMYNDNVEVIDTIPRPWNFGTGLLRQQQHTLTKSGFVQGCILTAAIVMMPFAINDDHNFILSIAAAVDDIVTNTNLDSVVSDITNVLSGTGSSSDNVITIDSITAAIDTTSSSSGGVSTSSFAETFSNAVESIKDAITETLKPETSTTTSDNLVAQIVEETTSNNNNNNNNPVIESITTASTDSLAIISDVAESVQATNSESLLPYVDTSSDNSKNVETVVESITSSPKEVIIESTTSTEEITKVEPVSETVKTISKIVEDNVVEPSVTESIVVETKELPPTKEIVESIPVKEAISNTVTEAVSTKATITEKVVEVVDNKAPVTAAAAVGTAAEVARVTSQSIQNIPLICPASDTFYGQLQRTIVDLVGSNNFATYGPVSAVDGADKAGLEGVLLRVRYESCIAESFFNDAITTFVNDNDRFITKDSLLPLSDTIETFVAGGVLAVATTYTAVASANYIAENGISWILPAQETVETFLAGDIFALATTSFVIGLTKVLTVLATFTDYVLGLTSRVVGKFAIDRIQGEPLTATQFDIRHVAPWLTTDRNPNHKGNNEMRQQHHNTDEEIETFNIMDASLSELVILGFSGIIRNFGDALKIIRDALEKIDIFTSRYLLLGVGFYVLVKFLHFRVFPDFPSLG